MSVQASGLLLAWVAIIGLAFATSGLLRQVQTLSAQLKTSASRSSTAVGRPAPELEDSGIGWDRPTLLVFAAADCQVCRQRLGELDGVAEQDGGGLALVAVFSGPVDGFQPRSVTVLENQRSAFERFGVPITPFGVLVNREGMVAHATALGSAAALDELVKTGRRLP
jgi:F plasmid transfer operon protein